MHMHMHMHIHMHIHIQLHIHICVLSDSPQAVHGLPVQTAWSFSIHKISTLLAFFTNAEDVPDAGGRLPSRLCAWPAHKEEGRSDVWIGFPRSSSKSRTSSSVLLVCMASPTPRELGGQENKIEGEVSPTPLELKATEPEIKESGIRDSGFANYKTPKLASYGQ